MSKKKNSKKIINSKIINDKFTNNDITKKELIQQKIIYLMSKYGHSVIWKKLPIDINLLDNKEMNYNYLADGAFFNLKKKNFYVMMNLVYFVVYIF